MIVTKSASFAKLFFILSLFGLFMYTILAFYTFQTAFTSVNKIEKLKTKKVSNDDYDKRFKYILLWTRDDEPINWTSEGQKIFVENDCSHTNCFITTNKSLLNDDESNFNAIVFSINTFRSNWKKYIPQERSRNQKYVFYSMVSAAENPVCNVLLDDFFNWTWTYKINSDIVTPFIEIRDFNRNVIAPKQYPNWFDLTTLDTFDMTHNITKRKAVMWYSDICENNWIIYDYIKKLKRALAEHELDLDVYDCRNSKCPNNDCLSLLSKTYYFYLAHERVNSEDYVTKEVLKAYHHNAVPIVVGGADYSRFLPPGSYINTQGHSVNKVAADIAYIMKNKALYYKFFIWRQYFTMHTVNPLRGYCDLCGLLNSRQKKEQSRYLTFRNWWHPGSLYERCLPKGGESFTDILSYRNDKMPANKMKFYYGIN